MAVPPFQQFLLPFLKFLGDGQEHTIQETFEHVARALSLSEDDRKELLPSGGRKYLNRVGWARTYLGKAGLLKGTGRGRFTITQGGTELLETNPSAISMAHLEQYPQFREFIGTADRATTQVAHPAPDARTEEIETPLETLQRSYNTLREALSGDILERVKECSPEFFEKLVVDLLTRMGYGDFRPDAGRVVGRSGDDGLDGVIDQDKLGLDAVFIQAKRWEANVGRPQVQAFVGALSGNRASKGVFITTSDFSKEARDYVGRIPQRIVLVDGRQLAELMIDHGIGVLPSQNYMVQRLDSDYFG